MSRIYAITNQKGGVGKTTTAVNLSACLAAAGKKVLLVDIDPQGNTTSGLGIDREGLQADTYDLLMGDRTAAEVAMPTRLPTLLSFRPRWTWLVRRSNWYPLKSENTG